MRKDLAVLVFWIAAACTAEVLLPTPRLAAGIAIGFLVTGSVAIVAFAFLLNGDASFLIAGALGERHTEDELEAAQKAGHVWSFIRNVEAGGRDVDHILLTPSGVLALETKWRFRGADAGYLAWAAGKAQEAARQARLVLQSKGVDYRTEVRPMLVIWGGARRELPLEQVVAGVDVVQGDHLVEWLKQCSRGRLAQDHAEDLHGKLQAFVATHAPTA